MSDGFDPMKNQIVFFDGHCNLCNRTIDYLIRNNKRRNLYFSSLQGKLSNRLGLDKNLESVIFWDRGVIYKNSSAAFALVPHIDHIASKILIPFKYLPRFISDFFYHMVSKSRYRLFGKRETCRLGTEEESKQFLA